MHSTYILHIPHSINLIHRTKFFDFSRFGIIIDSCVGVREMIFDGVAKCEAPSLIISLDDAI